MNNQGGRPRTGPGGATGVLHIIGGNDRGKQYAMVNPTTQIGRGADQDFVLADIAVSRRHVQVIIEGNRYRLRDLGSGNGTLVNGVRTATALLNDGDQIEIGNTLMRFDHPPSAARQTGMGPAASAPVPQAGGEARTMIAEAPQLPPSYAPPPPSYAPPPPAYAPPPAQTYAQPSPEAMRGGTAVAMPAPQVPTYAAPRGGSDNGKKLAIFGGLGLLLLAGGGFAAFKFAGGGGKAKADAIYAEATRSFQSQDYATAKRLFGEAAALDPENKLYPKQFKQCDVELHAASALKTARGLADDKRWEESFKALDTIDKSAVAWEDAEKLRKQAVPLAVAQYLGEAKEALANNDTATAKTKVEAATALDPDAADAKEVIEKLQNAGVAANVGSSDKGRGSRSSRSGSSSSGSSGSGGGSKFAAVGDAPAGGTQPKPAEPAASAPTTGKPAAVGTKVVDDESATAAAAAGGFDLLTSKGGAAYKAKDFAGAATQVRAQAKTLKGPAQQKANEVAAQVQRLGEAYDKAEADKTKNPVSAVSGYMQAATIDASYGKGTHGAFLKGQAGKLAKDAAKQAYAKQDFPTAFEMSKTALKVGDDGGVGAQLKQKAKELSASATGMLKSNPNGAKSLWRTVLRMVPPGDPSYVAAQKGLAASSGPAKDEDED